METTTERPETSKNQHSMLHILYAVGQVIRELGECSSGEIYAMLITLTEITLPQFESLVDMLVEASLVERNGHLLRWRA